MDLFSEEKLPRQILPRDGDTVYFGPLCDAAAADGYFDALLHEIDFQPDRVRLYGREIVTKRKVAWYGDEPYRYTYSHTTKTAAPWTSALAKIKALVEAADGNHYNCCLANLYHSGEEGMAWHSDDEKELRPGAPIASVSLGAERRFIFRHKARRDKAEIRLAHGSLLVMQGGTQTHWEHSLPVMKRVAEPRINLTFRTIERG